MRMMGLRAILDITGAVSTTVLIMLILLLGYWTIIDVPPDVTITERISERVRQGEDFIILGPLNRSLSDCPLDVRATVADGANTIWMVEPTLAETHDDGRYKLEARFPVPVDAAVGRASLHIRISYNCNPITSGLLYGRPAFFDILPAEEGEKDAPQEGDAKLEDQG